MSMVSVRSVIGERHEFMELIQAEAPIMVPVCKVVNEQVAATKGRR